MNASDAGGLTRSLVRRTDEPTLLEPIMGLGKLPLWGYIPWVLLALLTHTAALASPILSLMPMRQSIADMREELHAYFLGEYDLDIVEDTPEQIPPPPDETEDVDEEEEEIEPDKPKPLPLPKPQEEEEEDDPYDDEPPPAPAEAADVLTAGSEDEEVDLSRFGIVDKDGSKSTGGGMTSEKGTSKTPVHNKHAKVGGKVGGKGKGPVKKVKRKRNLSRSPALLGGRSWSCPFPGQADLEQVDRATAVVAITVGPNGRAKSVRIVSDPGYGFGAAARRCAASRRYRAARNANGNAITATMPPVRVHFRR